MIHVIEMDSCPLTRYAGLCVTHNIIDKNGQMMHVIELEGICSIWLQGLGYHNQSGFPTPGDHD